MYSSDQIPDLCGYLVLTEDGAVLTSGGALENDERIANIVTGLVTLTDKVDLLAFGSDDAFNTLTITYSDHCYVICRSNKKIHVVKKLLNSHPDSIHNRRNQVPQEL